jgi:hypothetical protein
MRPTRPAHLVWSGIPVIWTASSTISQILLIVVDLLYCNYTVHCPLFEIRGCIQKLLDWVDNEITILNTGWEGIQRAMEAKLTRLTHNIVIQQQLMAERCTICSSRSRRPVRKLLDTSSYRLEQWLIDIVIIIIIIIIFGAIKRIAFKYVLWYFATISGVIVRSSQIRII